MKRMGNYAVIATCFSLLILAARPAASKSSLRLPMAVNDSPAPYSNSTNGLHQLIVDMLDAQGRGGPQALGPFLQSLVLPDSATWFSNTFGEANGRQFAIFYDAWASFRNSQLSGDLARALAAQMTQIEVLRFDNASDPGTTQKDKYFLLIRQAPEPLYVVNFRSASGASMRWSYFVYTDGAFRYLGELPDLRLVAQLSAPEESQRAPELTERVRVGGSVMARKLEHPVAPVYPPDAAAAHIEGTVLLHSIVAKDGSVKELEVISGPSQLVKAAMDAVRQWHYQPTLLNGSPVEVDTTIAVQFNLGQKNTTPAASAPAPAAEASQPGPAAPAAAPAVAIPSYANSSGGLTKMMKEMLDMAKRGDNDALKPYYQALVLPDPGSWFPAQFGTQQGAQFAQYYAMVARSLESFFTNDIETDPDLRTSYVEVRRFKAACDSSANDAEYPILLAREVQSLPLYEVRFVKGSGYRWLFPFVYANGAFRYLGDLQIRAPQNHIMMPQSSGDSSGGSGVQMPKLIKEVQAEFPMGLNTRNAGMVKLWGVIATDGSVSNLHVIQGTCDFAKATIDAVKKWRFTPLMVNAQPQEMYYPFEYSFGPGQ
jgi:TonB family protein